MISSPQTVERKIDFQGAQRSSKRCNNWTPQIKNSFLGITIRASFGKNLNLTVILYFSR
jgi:hypothetical protein